MKIQCGEGSSLYTRKNVRKLTTSAEITTSQVHDANYVGREKI